MGKSRSATCVIAYLMQRYHITPAQALEQIRQSRPLCEPNEGFMQQLELYHEMQTPNDVENAAAYQRWLYQREVELSRAAGQAPEAEKIRFEDEHTSEVKDAAFDLRCRKCRYVLSRLTSCPGLSNSYRRILASSQYLIPHTASVADYQKPQKPIDSLTSSSPSCAHYFLDPLSWMRPELEQGKLDGRLECPKCRTNVGKYAWQGMQCSCGDWVVPAISLAKGRIDEAKSASAAARTMGIRLPPGVKPAGQQNL